MTYSYPFKRPPRDYQLASWEAGKDAPYRGLLFDPGLGKTWVVINTAAYLWDNNKIDSLVVVAPNGVHRNWLDEIEGVEGYQIGDLPDSIERKIFIWNSQALVAEKRILESALQPPPTGRMDILLMNVEALQSTRGQEYLEAFLQSHTALLALDESTTIKHHTSARAKFLIRVGKYAPYRRILTGSFTDNSPMDAYGQLDFLSSNILGHDSFYTFQRRFCHLIKMKRPGATDEEVKKNKRGATFMHVAGHKNLEELRSLMVPYCDIIKKEDALDLPAKVYQVEHIMMSAKQSAAYQQMQQESIATIEKHLSEKKGQWVADTADIDAYIEAIRNGTVQAAPQPSAEALAIFDPSTVSTAKIVLTQMMKLHQIACGFITTDDGVSHPVDDENPSVVRLLEKLEQLPGKVIIWANYRYNIQELVKAIGDKFGRETVADYYGSTSTEDRDTVRAEFRDPSAKVRFVVANQATGGRGLTLLDPTLGTDAQYVIYFSNDYDYERRRQSEDRDHRMGQTKSVIYIDFVRVGTIDTKILRAHRTKEKLSKVITASTWRQYIAA